MKCTKCGAHMEPNMRFCSKCGTPAPSPEEIAAQGQQSGGAQQGGKQLPVKWIGIGAAVIVVLIIIAVVSGSKKNSQEPEKDWDYVEATPEPTAEPTVEEQPEPTEEPEPTEAAPTTTDMTVQWSDANGALAEVEVELCDGAGNVVATATTGADGTAVFHDVPYGAYTVRAAKEDYTDAAIDNITVDESNAAAGVQLDASMEIKTTDLDVYTVVITDDSLVTDVDVYLYEGHNTTEGDPAYVLETDSEGLCTFEDVPNGNYTLLCVSDLYFRYEEDIHVGDDNVIKARLVPIPKEGEAYVVLDWDEPDLDLDLCVFNSDTREYINITHPRDKKGSFIHSDNKGYIGTEVILIRDVNQKNAQTVYVLDTTTAESDSRDSIMGRTGTHVTIYERYKDPVIYTMDPGENALVWTVCYFQSGEVTEMDENQYSNVVTDFIWAVDIIGSK